ncbi:hypothetical protein AMTRI_Chr08g167080 [Amborella trichopoda]
MCKSIVSALLSLFKVLNCLLGSAQCPPWCAHVIFLTLLLLICYCCCCCCCCCCCYYYYC